MFSTFFSPVGGMTEIKLPRLWVYDAATRAISEELPHTWDSAFDVWGRKYYWNIISCETTWKKPTNVNDDIKKHPQFIEKKNLQFLEYCIESIK